MASSSALILITYMFDRCYDVVDFPELKLLLKMHHKTYFKQRCKN